MTEDTRPPFDASAHAEPTPGDDDARCEFYRDSGIVPIGALTVLPACCFGVAAIGGVVYSFVMNYIPFIYAHVVIAILAGLGLGKFIQRMVVHWKVRSIPYAIGVALVTCSVAYYAAWGADILARFGLVAVDGQPFLAWYPPVLAEYIATFYREGFWSTTNGKPISGPYLALHWLAEAGAIFGYSLHTIWKQRTSRSFCEHCDRWTTMDKGVVKYYAGNEAGLSDKLAQRDFSVLADRLGVPQSADSFLWLNVHACPSCKMTRHVTIERIDVQTQSNGTQKIKSRTIVDRMEVEDETLQEILALQPPEED